MHSYDISLRRLNQTKLRHGDQQRMKYSAFVIAFFATIVRYYDYSLFGLASIALAQTFMPSHSYEEQILSFFMIFSASALVRPIGSIIFGVMGDRYGRVVALKTAAVLAALSTSLIGIMPSYEAIGISSTWLLMLCRMIFLISLAGEADGVKIYVAEKVGSSNKNLANGLVSFCSQVGVIIAAVNYNYVVGFSPNPFMWRFSFIIGGIAGLLLILLRGYFEETSEFLTHKLANISRDSLRLLKVFQVVRRNYKKFIFASLITGCSGGVYNLLIIFMSNFLATIAHILTVEEAKIMTILLIAAYACSSIGAGLLADYINPYRQVIISLALSILIAVIMLLLMPRQKFSIYMPLGLISLAPFYIIPLQIIMQRMFSVDIRMSMYSLSHSLGSIVFSGATPIICLLLWKKFNIASVVFWHFLMLTFLLLICVASLFFFLRNSRQQNG